MAEGGGKGVGGARKEGIAAVLEGNAAAGLVSSSCPNLASVSMHDRIAVTDALISSACEGASLLAGRAAAACPAWGGLTTLRDGSPDAWAARSLPAGAGRGVGRD